jgi:hypothetical protein
VVKILISLLFLLKSILAAETVVEAIIDKSQPHLPVEGTLTVTHLKSDKIDDHSFRMNGAPLSMTFVKDVPFGSDLTVTFYQFELPGQKQGNYTLSPISVKVGDQTVQSTIVPYEVSGETSIQPAKPTKKSSKTIFKLEAFVEGPTTLYLGERTKLIYRISFNRSVDLTNSQLPFIHPAHFQKVGDMQIVNSQEGDLSVQLITQEIKAIEMGTFQLGPSSIQGYAYQTKGEKKVYDPEPLEAKSAPIKIIVKSFPWQLQPESFTGALGNIKATAKLFSPAMVSIGDILRVEVAIQGIHNLEELSFPQLNCQPGFSGFFQLSDLPPVSEIDQIEQQKIFHLDLRPISHLAKQIPSIHLSSFDPEKSQFIHYQTKPIAIDVQPSSQIENEPIRKTIQLLLPATFPKRWSIPAIAPLPLTEKPIELYQKNRGEHYSLLGCAILLLCALFLQKLLKKIIRKTTPILESEKLLKQALKSDMASRQIAKQLEQAIMQRIKEKRNFSLKEVEPFLLQLQALQYSDKKTFDLFFLKKQAEKLFWSI